MCTAALQKEKVEEWRFLDGTVCGMLTVMLIRDLGLGFGSGLGFGLGFGRGLFAAIP